jgi:hypothetical protein
MATNRLTVFALMVCVMALALSQFARLDQRGYFCDTVAFYRQTDGQAVCLVYR